MIFEKSDEHMVYFVKIVLYLLIEHLANIGIKVFFQVQTLIIDDKMVLLCRITANGKFK